MQQEMLRALNHPRTIMEFLPSPRHPHPTLPLVASLSVAQAAAAEAARLHVAATP